MEHASSKPVDRPYHQDIEPSPYRVLEHRVECRTLIPTFGSADPLILVGLNDHPSTVSGNLLKDEPLVPSCLVITAHAQVDRCADTIGAHSSAHPVFSNYAAMIPPIPKLSIYPHGNGRHVLALCAIEASSLGGF
jgi:hypothetical protein